jgi:hypothetical protein
MVLTLALSIDANSAIFSVIQDADAAAEITQRIVEDADRHREIAAPAPVSFPLMGDRRQCPSELAGDFRSGSIEFWESGSSNRYALVFALIGVNAGAETALAVLFDGQAGVLKLKLNLAGCGFAAAAIKAGFAVQGNFTF